MEKFRVYGGQSRLQSGTVTISGLKMLHFLFFCRNFRQLRQLNNKRTRTKRYYYNLKNLT